MIESQKVFEGEVDQEQLKLWELRIDKTEITQRNTYNKSSIETVEIPTENGVQIYKGQIKGEKMHGYGLLVRMRAKNRSMKTKELSMRAFS